MLGSEITSTIPTAHSSERLSLTGVVGVHQGAVDVLACGVGVSVSALPFIQLLFDGTQRVVDVGGRPVCLSSHLLGFVDLCTDV